MRGPSPHPEASGARHRASRSELGRLPGFPSPNDCATMRRFGVLFNDHGMICT